MYPMNPEALYRLFQLEHEHRVKKSSRARNPETDRER
jgi:hypothetical protein